MAFPTLRRIGSALCSRLPVVGVMFALTMPAVATAQSLIDHFETPDIDSSFWSLVEQNGTVQLDTDVNHAGAQSVKFASLFGGQRYIQLIHRFASPTKGAFSIWFYDAAPGQETLYEQLQLTHSGLPGLSAGIGTMDFDAYCYMAGLAIPSENRGPNAACGIYPQITTTNVPRTLGWHRLAITVSTDRITFAIDGTQVFNSNGDFTFDTVTINVSGPFWRPNTTAWWDDFEFSPLTPPVITSLTATPDVLWPPNHKMVRVSVAVEASDGSGTAPACAITGVSSNELPTVLGETDWLITGPLALALRAERAGTGTGRAYAITVTCANASSLTGSQTLMVMVPHDRREH